jgi:plastocyanin
LRVSTKALLVAAAMACAAAPALAYSGATPGGSFTAVDFAWQANGTSGTTVTIAPGQTVTFGYPSGTESHDARFTGKQPSACPGLPSYPQKQGWSAECTFDAAGSYPFVCDFHPEMTGTVVVAAAATPTPGSSAAPTATADPIGTPGATATPPPSPGATPGPTATAQKQTTLKVKLAGTQRGTRVRGSVSVAEPASRLEVTVMAGKIKAGTYLKKSTASGTVSFSVTLNAHARRTLAKARRLRVDVAVALTPPGGKKLIARAKATVRPG